MPVYFLAVEAGFVGSSRFDAGFAEPDPEGGSFLGGGRQEGASARADELRRVRHGEPLTR